MIESNTDKPMYLVSGEVSDEQASEIATIIALNTSKKIGVHQAVRAIGSPIQPCAEVETAAVIRASSPVTPTTTKAVKRDLFPVGVDVELVRRTDMEVKLSVRDRLVKATMRALDAKTGHYQTVQNERDVLKDQIARLRGALSCAKDAITSDLNSSSIVCTVWAVPGETLVDFIDAALNEGTAA
ncbi:hypothetical protein MSKU15_1248 [Komagataeibacter diospyri]|uniref:hypothetical protein n=1 Tax=Komagataeibacter diospyri TaxID=1932662 RepID=UPI00113DDD32|nr:hypothetical protein [Komagataeibacter diospyri]GCE89647.1 hypothetical protein MSKU15_1248 [Komagataeibacter diospyri]